MQERTDKSVVILFAGSASCIKRLTDLPVAVGFGISTAVQVKKFAAPADGVVIGSAFVKWLDQHDSEKDLFHDTFAYARALKEATIVDPSG